MANDFKDVLIVPRNTTSKYESRKEVNLEQTYTFNNGMIWRGIPLICSNMHNIATIDMAKELQKFKIITWFSKFIDYNDLRKAIDNNEIDPNYCGITLGLNDRNNFREILEKFPEIFFIRLDTPNGYMNAFQEFIKLVCLQYGKSKVIFAGNIIPQHSPFGTDNIINKYQDLHQNLSGMVIGIGSGGVCSTRNVTGIGYPQFSAVSETSDIVDSNIKIISDGGIRNSGDVVKAFVAGADFVVLGSILAGHLECAGNTIQEKQQIFGGASRQAQLTFYDGEDTSYKSPEGISTTVNYKGYVKDTIEQILGGLRSAFTYLDANDYLDLNLNSDVVTVNRQTDNI